MSVKSKLSPYRILTAGDMSLTSLTSQVTNIQNTDNIAIQANFTGAPVGTFSVEVSVDHAQDSQGNVTNAGTWNALTLSATPVASGSSGSVYIDLNQLSAPYIRLVYTKGSGTGTLNAFITAKRLGG